MFLFLFFFKQKTAYEMRISDWSSDVCSSDLTDRQNGGGQRPALRRSRGTTDDPPDQEIHYHGPGITQIYPLWPLSRLADKQISRHSFHRGTDKKRRCLTGAAQPAQRRPKPRDSRSRRARPGRTATTRFSAPPARLASAGRRPPRAPGPRSPD